MDILLTAGLPWPTILYTVLIDEVMIITGLVGALVTSSYKVQKLCELFRGSTVNYCGSGDTSSLDASLLSGLGGLSSGPAASTQLPLAPMFREPTSRSVPGLLSSGSFTQSPGDFLRVAMSSHLTLRLCSTVSWTSWLSQSLVLS